MLSKRVLLLGAALASFSAMMVGGAFAFSSVQKIDTSAAVAVADPVDPELDLVQTDGVIPADGQYHAVDDIQHRTTDTAYAWQLTQLDVTGNGTSSGTCGTHDYTLAGPADSLPSLTVAVPTTWGTTGYSLYLSIASTNTEVGCQISGGEVTATFQIS